MEVNLPDGVLSDAWETSRKANDARNQVQAFLERTGLDADHVTKLAQELEPWFDNNVANGAPKVAVMGGMLGRAIQVGYQIRVNEEAKAYDATRHD